MPRRRACDSCHVKKIHCDGAEPRCEWCTHRDIVCTYGRIGIPKNGKFRACKKTVTAQEQTEQRIARLKVLLDFKTYVSSSRSLDSGINGAPSEATNSSDSRDSVELYQVLSGMPRQGIFYSNTMHFAGFDIDDITAQVGIPVFCKDGLRWIQDKAGASKLFEDMYKTRYQQHQAAPPLVSQPGEAMKMPPKSIASLCLQIFSTSPLRRVFPVINITDFKTTLEQAYDFGKRSISLPAQACIQSFTALVTLLEPGKIPLTSTETELYSHEAQVSLIEILVQLRVEGLQAALMLCIYHDLSGNIRSAALIHSMALQCVYGLGAHLDQQASPFPNASGHLRDLFWLYYFFDRHISLRTGRPPLLNNDECSLSLDGYLGLAAIQHHQTLLFPCDLGLTILKSEVYKKLYSRSAAAKSDMEYLQDIRDLDDRLEEWRLSLPEFARPSLSILHFGAARDVLENEFATWIVFTHLEYLYLLSAIHRACGRCATTSYGTDGLGAFNSSLMLSLHASRATLGYLGMASKHMHGEIFWLVVFYPIWATVTIFSYILHDPKAASTTSDVELLRVVPSLVQHLRKRPPGLEEKRHLDLLEAFVAELVRLAGCAIERAKKHENAPLFIEEYYSLTSS
ncbi:hypothetical protein B0I35DRAFT_434347 [Stachybotrys elegans]|uniref:Zn(2)-C6 fungal-type domain-containing protein n=1 Tax=Stachybotrys elegans TaxID=80388 RepID=A0A8K0WPZ7_9HYPO|nr:hypothetical protein B0I35DRAFT_434347 [Stachybotrys elegans]